jgi:CIC family chloride channel protein
MLLIAVVVGIGAGLGAVVFRQLINGIHEFSYGDVAGWLSGMGGWHLLVIPALGGAIVGPLVHYYAREAKGHGVPEVMQALELRGGRIRPRVAIVKALASSVCIGTGGSVGREGPIAQIGSALGSWLGQLLKLSDDRLRTLVACGAAGGVAATFNAPIAGAVFALEVLLRRFGSAYFGAVVISAVTADVVAHYFEGDSRTFAVPQYVLNSPWELGLYLVLGLLAAVLSVGFTRLLYFSEDLWDKIRVIPEPAKPIAGGVLLGVLGIYTFQLEGIPRIFGVGYETITSALFSELTLQMTLALLFLKMLATALTLGAGGSGGVFAPSLFMGAMLGACFGQAAGLLFPEIAAPSGAYALVGMAAFFSGAAHAPITSILILFEMTGNYEIILPLMLATVVSTLISRKISRESIYTLKLSRRGVVVQQQQEVDLMQRVSVGEAMHHDVETVSTTLTLEELSDRFAHTHRTGFLVVENGNQLVGVVSIGDLERALGKPEPQVHTVQDIATTENLLVATPEEPMWVALRQLGIRDIGRLPVVRSESDWTVVGVLRRIDIIRAYNHAINEHALEQHRDEMLQLRHLDQTGLIQLQLPANSPVVGRRVRELSLGEDCLLVSVRRKGRLRLVRGETVLQAGDQVTVFAEKPRAENLRKQLLGEAPMEEQTQNGHVRHREVSIPAQAEIVGRPVRELQLPQDCVLVRVLRGSEIILPRGDTVLQAQDRVEIFGVDERLSEAEQCLIK